MNLVCKVCSEPGKSPFRQQELKWGFERDLEYQKENWRNGIIPYDIKSTSPGETWIPKEKTSRSSRTPKSLGPTIPLSGPKPNYNLASSLKGNSIKYAFQGLLGVKIIKINGTQWLPWKKSEAQGKGVCGFSVTASDVGLVGQAGLTGTEWRDRSSLNEQSGWDICTWKQHVGSGDPAAGWQACALSRVCQLQPCGPVGQIFWISGLLREIQILNEIS